MREENQRMMKPIVYYFEGLCLEEERYYQLRTFEGLCLEEERYYQLRTNLSTVTASLTPQQIDDLKKESYVRYVIKDFQLEPIK